MSDYLIRELQAATNVTIRYHCEVAAAFGDEHLERISVATRPKAIKIASNAPGCSY